MSALFVSIVSLVVLFCISACTDILSRYFKLPYTVFLVGVGIFVGILVTQIPGLSFITAFELTPEVLLYVFLPILLFESAYNIRYRELLSNIASISALAVIALTVSSLLVASGLYYILPIFGFEPPFLVCLLFGSLISATDPVSVLALFKNIGAPKRLSLIFEGESLFNDGTALALFLVVLAVLVGTENEHRIFDVIISPFSQGSIGTFVVGFLSFSSMVVGGIIFGVVVGILFSRVISKVHVAPLLEIGGTVVLAHSTFLAAEALNHFVLPISGVIATTIAAMVVGNYGRLKISPEVCKTLGHYWEFFAFLANSLVFLLLGVLLVNLDIGWSTYLIAMFVVIPVVAISRAISVYGVLIPFNTLQIEKFIPRSWQHLLSWGSLRGALAIIMVLLVPTSLTFTIDGATVRVQDFLLALTAACIIFTTFIKALTIEGMMKGFGVTQPEANEMIDLFEAKLLTLFAMKTKLKMYSERGHIDHQHADQLTDTIAKKEDETIKEFKKILTDSGESAKILVSNATRLYALTVEKYWLGILFENKEVSEHVYKELDRRNEAQRSRIENGLSQLKTAKEATEMQLNLGERVVEWLHAHLHKTDPVLERYMLLRVRRTCASKAKDALNEMAQLEIIRKTPGFDDVCAQYDTFISNAQQKIQELISENTDKLHQYEGELLSRSFLRTQKDIVSQLIEQGLISPSHAAEINI